MAALALDSAFLVVKQAVRDLSRLLAVVFHSMAVSLVCAVQYVAVYSLEACSPSDAAKSVLSGLAAHFAVVVD